MTEMSSVRNTHPLSLVNSVFYLTRRKVHDQSEG